MNTQVSKIRIYRQPDGELVIDTDKEIYICKNVEVVGINFSPRNRLWLMLHFSTTLTFFKAVSIL